MWNRRAAPGAEWIKVRRPSIYLSLSLANGVSTGYERYVVDYILLTGREIPGQQKRDMFIYSFACFLFCVVCICMDSCYATACLHVVLFVTCVLWNKINEWMKQYQTWQTATTTSYKLLLVRGKKNTIRYDTIRYDTIGEFNVDWKAEYSALSSTRSQKKKLKQPTPVPL